MQIGLATELFDSLRTKYFPDAILNVKEKFPHRAWADINTGVVYFRLRSLKYRNFSQVKRDFIHELAHLVLGRPGHTIKWKKCYFGILDSEKMTHAPPMSPESQYMYFRLFWITFSFLVVSYYAMCWIGIMPGAPRFP